MTKNKLKRIWRKLNEPYYTTMGYFAFLFYGLWGVTNNFVYFIIWGIIFFWIILRDGNNLHQYKVTKK